MRHGKAEIKQCKGRVVDLGLTPKGRNQVETAAKNIKGLGVTFIYSSTARRARETSKILSQELGIGIRYCSLLKAVKSPQGKDLAELVTVRKGKKWQDEWIKGWPGFESPKDYQERILRALPKIIKTHPEENILIIGHDETVWAILSFCKGISFSEAIKIRVPNASLYEFTFSKKEDML